ncbi:unnamed protein product [Lampetra planeri]
MEMMLILSIILIEFNGQGRRGGYDGAVWLESRTGRTPSFASRTATNRATNFKGRVDLEERSVTLVGRGQGPNSARRGSSTRRCDHRLHTCEQPVAHTRAPAITTTTTNTCRVRAR